MALCQIPNYCMFASFSYFMLVNKCESYADVCQKSKPIDKLTWPKQVRRTQQVNIRQVNIRQVNIRQVNTQQINTVTNQAVTKRSRSSEGKLINQAASIFQRAYGLNGYKLEPHDKLIAECMSKYKCSQRAMFALLYG